MPQTEIALFKAFVASPLFNTRDTLISLLDEYLVRDKSPEDRFAAVFPGRPFQPKAYNTLTGELYDLLKRFWAHQELEKRPELRNILGLHAMRDHGLERHFEAEAKRINKHLEQSSRRDPDHYYYRYLLADEQNAWYAQRLVRRFDASLQNKMDALDAFYFGAKFGNSAEALSRNSILNAQYELPFLESLCALFDRKPGRFPPSVKVYRQLLTCLQVPGDRRHYDEFSELLSTHAADFPPEEARALFKTAQNYCIRRINLGETSFQEELFVLYQSLLERRLIFDGKDQLAHTDFKNIVTVGLRQEAFAWVADFIETHSNDVDEAHRDNVRHYCLALYHAEHKEPNKAIRLLAEVHFTDTLYDLSARRLLAQCYYEQQDWEGLAHHLNAFDLFLRRKKDLATQIKNSHLHFVKILKAIAKLQEQAPYLNPKKKDARLQTLKARILRTEPLAYREWLGGLIS
ncbi:MAG: hypothetical protein AB8F95_15915 [Bacteroidia bacterium]